MGNWGVYLIIAILWGIQLPAVAQTSIQRPDWSVPSLISPYYFGPNAFPVPDLLDGTVSPDLRISLYTDNFWGKRGDNTSDIGIKIVVPLFTDRVNLCFWMPYLEFYKNTDENIEACRIKDVTDKRLYKGHFNGDAYVSCDIQIIREKKRIPSMTARMALKTASSDGYYLARFYDSPGYFFDASLGKNIEIASSGFFRNIRASGTLGFLCWQTDNGRQNDALLYGIQLKLQGPKFEFSCAWSGYSGWESGLKNNRGAHDRPQTLKLNTSCHLGKFDITLGFQEGLRDYPYRQLRLGTTYNIDILGKMKNREK